MSEPPACPFCQKRDTLMVEVRLTTPQAARIACECGVSGPWAPGGEAEAWSGWALAFHALVPATRA